jgi:murein L,D-transpeptidase YcbB/YkuD
MATAGCVAGDAPLPTGTAPSPNGETSTAFLKTLREAGVKLAVPAHGKFILVNIPSYELVALEDGVPVLRSRVIVGRPALRTPELLSPISAVRFNPAWMPTPSMIRNEAAHYIPPGPHNPLGRLMFELDNDQFIFLHDTNQKALFNRERRAFSHGCVRVEQARPLAAWALGVSGEEIDRLVARGATYSMPVPDAIPVFLGYFTSFPDEHGQIATYPDIYANWEEEERAYLARAAAQRRAWAPPPAGEAAKPPGPSAAPEAPAEPAGAIIPPPAPSSP